MPDIEFYLDPDWQSYRAPVVPPKWVIDLLVIDGRPVWWNNSGCVNDKCYPMHYQTEFENQKVVTRLLPGSGTPTDDWLQK